MAQAWYADIPHPVNATLNDAVAATAARVKLDNVQCWSNERRWLCLTRHGMTGRYASEEEETWREVCHMVATLF